MANKLISVLLAAAVAEQVTVAIVDSMVFSWTFLNDTAANFTLTCKVQNWCAIGFGSSMSNTDMIQVSGPGLTLGDLYSTEHSEPPTDVSKGGYYNLESPVVTTNGSYVSGTFVRSFNTGDKYDAILIPNSSFALCYAYLDSGTDFSFHSDGWGAGTLSFYSTQNLSSFGGSSSGTDYDDDYELHGNYMSLAWMLLAPIGLIAARYFKGYRIWIVVHFFAMSVVIGITLISVTKTYKHNEGIYDQFSKNQRYHSRMGLTISALVVTQGLVGCLIRWFARKKETLMVLLALRWLHWVTGWALAIVALVEVRIGWKLKDSDKLDFIYPLYGVYAGIFVIFELLNRFGYKFLLKKSNWRFFTYPEVLEAVQQGKQWAFFNDLVIDVGPFADSHPGGQVMIKATLGEDIGKYIYASSSWVTPPHYHSVNAHSLLAQLAIGKVRGPSVLSEEKEFAMWRLIAKTKLSENTWQLTFAGTDIKVIDDLAGVEWIGKHFLLTYGGISRYYSFSNCQAINEKRNWHAQARSTGAQLMPLNEPVEASVADYGLIEAGKGLLAFTIKNYPYGAMTPMLTGAPLNTNVKIAGPFGPGLALNESFSGDLVGVAGGTGLVPFLDLAHLLWKRTRGESNKLQSLRLTLYVTFSTIAESFGLDLLKALEISNSQQFRIVINFSESQLNPLNSTLPTLINPQSVARVAVCGPSGFNRAVESILAQLNVSKSKILIL